MDERGVIKIDGKPYHIELPSWHGKDIMDFSPRASVPGSGLMYSELGMYQPVLFQDWSHGFGFMWHTDEAGYMKTEGSIDTRHSGLAMMMTVPVESDTDAHVKEGATVFGDSLYTWGEGGVRRFKDSAWADVAVVFTHVDYDNPQFYAFPDDSTPLSQSFTMPSKGANRILLVHTVCKSDRTFSAANLKYNNVAFTEYTSRTGSTPYIQTFFLINPTADGNPHNLTLSWSGGSSDIMLVVQALYYVDQTTPFIQIDDSAGSGTAATDAITGAVGNIALDILAKVYGASDALTKDVGAEQVALGSAQIGTSETIACSVEQGAAGTNTLAWSWTNSRAYGHRTIEVAASADSAHAINFLFSNGDYLFMCPDGERIQKSANGGVTPADWSIAGINANASDFQWLLAHSGLVYAGKQGKSHIYTDGHVDLSDLHGDPTDDTQEILVGAGGFPTSGGVSAFGKLYIGRADGLWEIGEDRIARRALNFVNEASTYNFRSLCFCNGGIYFPVRDRLYLWNGARLTNATPKKMNDAFPYLTYGQFDNLVPVGELLYFTARTNETVYTESIICMDTLSLSCHRIADVITDGDGYTSMMAYDPVNNRLWYHVYKPTAVTNKTSYIQFQALSEFPYANFPTTGTHRIYSSRIEAGFRRVTKSMPRLLLQTSNCDAGTYLNIYISLDGATPVLWDAIKDNGLTELTEPASFKTVEFDYMQLVFEFVTDTATQSPILEGAVEMVMMRPDVRYGYTFNVVAASNLVDGMQESLTQANEIILALRAARDSKHPVLLETPTGMKVWGYISAYDEQALEKHMEQEDRTNIEFIVQVNFVETLVDE